jgi:Flp pilus assembly pilin Flp
MKSRRARATIIEYALTAILLTVAFLAAVETLAAL